MADTIKNIPLPAGVWVNLYSESSIDVGTQINAANIGANSAKCVAVASSPEVVEGWRLIAPGEESINDSGDSGAWAYSVKGTTLNVKVVV